MGQSTKVRSEWIGGKTAGVVDRITIHQNPVTGEIMFGTEMVEQYSQVTYERTKGEKVVLRTPLAGPGLDFDPDTALLAETDILFAVDTNTRDLRGQRVSVTAMVEGRKMRHRRTGALAVQPRPVLLAELHDVQCDPEVLGWAFLFDYIHRQRAYNAYRRIKIIVDSSLGELDAYNARKKPVYRGKYLPPHITLAYASSDVGRTYISSKMITLADRYSADVLDRLADGSVPWGATRVSGAPFRALRWIHPRVVCP